MQVKIGIVTPNVNITGTIPMDGDVFAWARTAGEFVKACATFKISDGCVICIDTCCHPIFEDLCCRHILSTRFSPLCMVTV